MNKEQNALNFMLYLLDDPWILTAMRGELTEEYYLDYIEALERLTKQEYYEACILLLACCQESRLVDRVFRNSMKSMLLDQWQKQGVHRMLDDTMSHLRILSKT